MDGLKADASVIAAVRDARPDEAIALESLQRRASDVWEEYRADLEAHPDAIAPPHRAIAEGRVRVAVDPSGNRLGFSTVLAIENGRCELDDLFVEPDRMRQGVGRLLVDDLAARAAATGASHVDVTANPNALGFYSRLGFEVTGHTETRFGPAPRMTLPLQVRRRNADNAAISRLMRAFLDAVSFEQGQQPRYSELADLFIPDARLIRNSGPSPEISTVEEFAQTRWAAYRAGSILWFEETELGATVELFGNVAHRFSAYRKRAGAPQGSIDARGAISTQFVRTADGWRINAMAWDDERPGLKLADMVSDGSKEGRLPRPSY